MSHDRVPTRELIDELRAAEAALGHPPRSYEMDVYGDYTSGTFHERFGSWIEALEAAGIEPDDEQVSCGKKEIPDGDLLSELRRLADDLGKTPTTEDMVALGEYGASTFQKRFGSWNRAIWAAGLEPNRKTAVSDDDTADGGGETS